MIPKESRGYLIVATLSKSFYTGAVECIKSLKDEVPDAQVAFFTHEMYVKDEDRHLFDHLFTPAPVHNRAKLWALPMSPFEYTTYLDADSFVCSDEIEEVWEHLDNAGDDVDVLMSENRPYNAKVVLFQDSHQNNGEARELNHWDQDHINLALEGKAHIFRWHCGMFTWRKNDRTQKLWKEWLRYYRNHNESTDGSGRRDKSGVDPYPRSLAYWDTFAFWRVLHEQPDLNINIQRMPKDAKYNYVTGYKETELRYGEEYAVFHYTIPPELVHEETYNETSIDTTCGSLELLK